MKSFDYFWWNFEKIKNYLQIGNKVYLNYNSKFENKIGYFKIK